MKEYHKINTIFKRHTEGADKNKLIIGAYSQPEVEYLRSNMWSWTEKIDGTNIRILWDGINIRIGGKTNNAQIPVSLYERVQELFHPQLSLFEELWSLTEGETPTVCLYGEGFGRKIQKAGASYLPDSVDFILFDVKIGEWWLRREDIEDIARQFNIRVVPEVLTGDISDAIRFICAGSPSTIGEAMMEGLVGKPLVELKSRMGRRIITKIKHKDFVGVDLGWH
jgi:hypothetical protein